MNILVTGSHGQLGRHIEQRAKQIDDRFFFTDIDTLDITDEQAVKAFFRQHNIELTINCAAYTNVDKAEIEEDVADRVNHHAVLILAEATREMGGTLIHISTDYVFGGNTYNTPCRETMPLNPTGAYGRTKLAGEQAILTSGCHHVIIRTAWLYSEYGKNFLLTMLKLTKERPQCSVVYDQVGTPTYAGDLAEVIMQIVTTRAYHKHQGIYHYSNEGVCSWYDFSKEIALMAGHAQCDIRPCLSNEYPSKVVRPAYSVLDKGKIKSTFGIAVPYWTDSLKECIDNIKAQTQMSE